MVKGGRESHLVEVDGKALRMAVYAKGGHVQLCSSPGSEHLELIWGGAWVVTNKREESQEEEAGLKN